MGGNKKKKGGGGKKKLYTRVILGQASQMKKINPVEQKLYQS